jgi:hypothetical protein
MKHTKPVLALALLLLGYGVWVTILSVGLEKRLSRLEASHQKLESEYRVLSNTLAHVQMTPELTRSLAAAMVEEGRRLPVATNRDLRLLGSEFNSPPAAASTK